MLNSFSREYSRDNGFIVVYEYANNWSLNVFDHALQNSDKSKRPTSQSEVTVQHLVEYRQFRAVAASLKARYDDPSKQYRGGGWPTYSKSDSGGCGGEFEGKV